MNEALTMSVIVPTADRAAVLDLCLAHLQQQNYPRMEIIVVDNSRDTEATKGVLARHPAVRYICEAQYRDNPGALRNLGVAASSGDIVAFIDDDCLAAPDWLSWLVQGYVDGSVGGVGGRLISEGIGVSSDAETGRLLPDGTVVANFEANPSCQKDVDYLTAGNMSLRRSVFLLVGGFDLRMSGMGYEELDLGMRVNRAGYRLIFEPRAATHHLAAPRPEGVSVRASYSKPEMLYAHTRNLTYIRLSNLGLRFDLLYLWNTFMAQPRITCSMFLRHPSRHTLSLSAAVARGTAQGTLYALTTRRKRKRLARN